MGKTHARVSVTDLLTVLAGAEEEAVAVAKKIRAAEELGQKLLDVCQAGHWRQPCGAGIKKIRLAEL